MSEFLRATEDATRDEPEPAISHAQDHMQFLFGAGLPVCPTQDTLEDFVKTHIGQSLEKRALTHNGERIFIVGENQGGGIGKIFFGYRESDGKLVALRVLKDDMSDEDMKQRFLAEQEFFRARNADPVRYWAEFFGAGEMQIASNEEEKPRIYSYSAVEFLLGRDIASLIRTSSEFVKKPQVSLAVGMQLCHALSFWEKDGYVIRDIDPNNVMITQPAPGKPFVRLFDANLLWRQGRERNLTPPYIIYGKVHYLAPERACGRTYDHRIDIFSIGSIMYEMLAGRKVNNDNNDDVLRRAKEGRLPPSIFGHETLSTILFRFLDADPVKRPSTGDEARRLLRDYYAAHHLEDPLTQFIGPAFTEP